MTTYTDEQLKRALAKMLPGQIHTDTEINIAIAEACGWEKQVCAEIWWNPQKGKYATVNELPSYTIDLNAMHEAEKELKWEQRKQYHDILADVAGFSYCEADTQEETELNWNCRICHATTSQRAEAFLRTIGKWKE